MSIHIPSVTGKVMVVGFLFTEDKSEVVLIRKNKPVWQKDRLNGVGGKLEPGETAASAMSREFLEETGITFTGWELYCEMMHGKNAVFFFKGTSQKLATSRQPENAEQADWFNVQEAASGKLSVVPNLKWLIPLALEKSVTADVCDSTEVLC